MTDRNGVQQAGDYIITPFPGGYLIGRLRVKVGSLFGYEYIGNDERLNSALRKASQLAKQQQTALWVYEGDGTYGQAPLGDPL